MLLRCPDCREKFKWDAEKPWPKFCPCCGEDINNDRDDIVMPFVSKAKHTYSDTVYSEIEKASEVRAEIAAEKLGVPVSEMSGLKITNLQDGRRQGDIHAPPVNNEVSRIMQQAPQMLGFQGSNGVEYGNAVMTGAHPNVGARMRTMIQNNHREMVATHAVGRDEQGHFVIPKTDVTSDRPALETQQPGYRRRG
jgi:hypothetical protein